MTNPGFDDTVQSLRRILTTGAVAAALLLVGAAVLFAASLLFQVARIAPFGGWGVLAVLALAAIVAAAVWLRGARVLGGRRHGPVFTSEMVFRAPPAAPVRAARTLAPATTAGRLGAETLINRLVAERRYDEALARLEQLEAADPALAPFCAVKRRTIARRQGWR